MAKPLATLHVRRSQTITEELPRLTYYLQARGIFGEVIWTRHKAGPTVWIYDIPPCGGYCGAALWVQPAGRTHPYSAMQLDFGHRLAENAWAVAWCRGAANAIEFLRGLGWEEPLHVFGATMPPGASQTAELVHRLGPVNLRASCGILERL